MNVLLKAEKHLVKEEAGVAPLMFLGEARLIKPYVENYTEHPYGSGLELKYASVER